MEASDRKKKSRTRVFRDGFSKAPGAPVYGAARAVSENKTYIAADSAFKGVSAKITSKGQVTIPKNVRDALNVREGDQVLFEIQGNSAKVRKITALDSLAMTVGPQLREEFPTPEDFEAFLRKNRKELYNKIYGDQSDKGSH